MHCRLITSGPWFLARLVSMLLQGNGSSVKRSLLTAHLTTTKLGGFFADLASRNDYDETFSHVVKSATIRVVLTLALSRSWPIHQLDVKNAFLHGTLTEIVYCVQPSMFVDYSSRPDHVCRLNKSLNGLKQAPRT